MPFLPPFLALLLVAFLLPEAAEQEQLKQTAESLDFHPNFVPAEADNEQFTDETTTEVRTSKTAMAPGIVPASNTGMSEQIFSSPTNVPLISHKTPIKLRRSKSAGLLAGEEEEEDADEDFKQSKPKVQRVQKHPNKHPVLNYGIQRGPQTAEFLFPMQEDDAHGGDDGQMQRPAAAGPPEPRPRDLSTNPFHVSSVPLMRLTKDVLASGRYDVRVRPVVDHARALRIHISMSLYQIIEVNEPAQNIKMNVWMIQKWRDEMLHWDPREYDMINSTILPHEVLWIPDTYLYNSVVMNAEETERYMNIRADSLHWDGEQGSNMSFLYPAIYTVTCRLNIRYFPYDQQNCTLTISSWTNSKSALDYYADPEVNLASFIANEEWDVMSFRIFRHEYKYACCPEPWVILEASIVIRRKPLYYVINLIIPTSIITLVAITGFFTPASTADDRTEKINLGITTLLAMSILMLMVSDQMPTTSEFVPLIAWFYLSIIVIISIGTFLTSVILSIQGRRQYGQLPSLWIRHLFFVKFAKWLWLSIPPPLLALWEEMNDHPLATVERLRKETEEKQERKQLRKSLRRSLKKSAKSMGPSLTFEGDGSVVIQASPKSPAPIEGEWAIRRSHYQPGNSPTVLSPVSENGVDGAVDQQQPSPKSSADGPSRKGSSRARRNWLRVSSIMSKRSNRSNQQQRTAGGITPSPRSPAVSGPPPPPIQLNPISSSRRSSHAETNWENAIGGLGVVTVTPRPPAAGKLEPAGVPAKGKLVSRTAVSVSAEVNAMKVKRQCSLEWEFLATILDRLFLIIFSLTTIIVTLGMMATGKVAQWQYEQAARDSG